MLSGVRLLVALLSGVHNFILRHCPTSITGMKRAMSLFSHATPSSSLGRGAGGTLKDVRRSEALRGGKERGREGGVIGKERGRDAACFSCAFELGERGAVLRARAVQRKDVEIRC